MSFSKLTRTVFRSFRPALLHLQKPRGANINNVTFGLTGRADLMGLAIDGQDHYYSHSLDGFLYSVDPGTGALTQLCETGK